MEANDVALARNLAEIDRDREKYSQQAELHRQSIRSDNERAAADRLAAEVSQQKDDTEAMKLNPFEMAEDKQKYFLELQSEAMHRMRIRKAKRLADLESARVEGERAATAARLAEEYANSPKGIAAAVAAVEAADAADRIKAMAAVVADAARSRASERISGNVGGGTAAPATPPVTPINLSVGAEVEEEEVDEEEEGEQEEGETEEEAYATLLEEYANQMSDDEEEEEEDDSPPEIVVATPIAASEPLNSEPLDSQVPESSPIGTPRSESLIRYRPKRPVKWHIPLV